MVSHPKTPILNCFYHLLWFYCLTVSEISCLAKSYSVSGLTPMPHIPNQHHYTTNPSDHNRLGAPKARRDRSPPPTPTLQGTLPSNTPTSPL